MTDVREGASLSLCLSPLSSAGEMVTQAESKQCNYYALFYRLTLSQWFPPRWSQFVIRELVLMVSENQQGSDLCFLLACLSLTAFSFFNFHSCLLSVGAARLYLSKCSFWDRSLAHLRLLYWIAFYRPKPSTWVAAWLVSSIGKANAFWENQRGRARYRQTHNRYEM